MGVTAKQFAKYTPAQKQAYLKRYPRSTHGKKAVPARTGAKPARAPVAGKSRRELRPNTIETQLSKTLKRLRIRIALQRRALRMASGRMKRAAIREKIRMLQKHVDTLKKHQDAKKSV